MRQRIGTVALVLSLPLFVLVGFLVWDQQADEVAADAVTTGTVVAHQEGARTGDDVCDVEYVVDGEQYETQDDCTFADTPVGSDLTVNYVADDPGAGFIHGDVGWWDKLRTVLTTVAVIGAFLGVIVIGLRVLGRRGSGAGGGQRDPDT